jgi:carbonic anhydrase
MKDAPRPPASKLLDGNLRFQQWFREDRETFAKLVLRQDPRAFYVGCSDSRVVPNFILDAAPGEVFVARNVGGIVPPPHDPLGMSIGAALEFAVDGLGVEEIIVCGHDDCGALKGIVAGKIELQTNLGYWLKRGAESVKPLGDLKAIPMPRLVEHFVRAQFEHLREFDLVRRAIDRGVTLHAWVYDPGTGRIRAMSEDGIFHEIMGDPKEPPRMAAAE